MTRPDQARTLIVVRFIISCCVLAALATTAFADKARAKRHMVKALKAYEAGRYEDARKEFAIAYSSDPQPLFLFKLGEVNVKLGKCEVAVTFLEKYLETKPDEAQVTATNEALATCNAATTPPADATVNEDEIEIDDPTKPQPVPPPAPVAPLGPAVNDTESPFGLARAAPAPQTPSPTPRRDEGPSEPAWYQEPVGLALCGGGVLGVVAASVFYGMALGKVDEAEVSPRYDTAIALRDNAQQFQIVSIATAAVGIGLLGAGGYYYFRWNANRDARVSAIPTTTGAMIGLAGRF